MAALYPQLTEDSLHRLPSEAERSVYSACQALTDTVIVLFSVPWVRVTPYGTTRDGETDFVLIDPQQGILIIEVKGGGVSIEPATGNWFSIDRNGTKHAIKDPFRQATSEKYALLSYLKEHQAWTALGLQPTVGHAVMLADLDDVSLLVGIDRPREIVGSRTDLDDIGAWLRAVFEFWAKDDRPTGISKPGINVIEKLFCREIEVRPMLSSVLAEEESERIRLTDEQTRLVRGLRRRNRAVVAGGAGTGKTLLAINKAIELGDEGKRTLLLCYNRPLADHLSATTKHTDVDAMSFHQLAIWLIRMADNKTGRRLINEAADANPAEDKYDVHFPHALALATECIDRRYDAIIVDEAQDFGEEFWLPIEMLLVNEAESTLFLFYDHNQSIYQRVSTFPILDEPFLLTRNCRNTKEIHDATYSYYEGEPTEPPTIHGDKPGIISAPSRGSEGKKLHAHLISLITSEKINPESIAVLVPGRGAESYYEMLTGRPLPHPYSWAIEKYGQKNAVRVDTVNRFKGLEADIVYFWGADTFNHENDREILYVSLSRAKARVFLVGGEEKCAAILTSAKGES